MPNWTENQLVIETRNEKDMQTILDFIKGEEQELDFNSIVPMPEILTKITKGHTTIDGVSYSNWIQNDEEEARPLTKEELAECEKTGFSDWYEFAVNKWGCKWNASNVDVEEWSDTHVAIIFETPWSPPSGIYAALVEKFEDIADINLNYRLEDDNYYPNSL